MHCPSWNQGCFSELLFFSKADFSEVCGSHRTAMQQTYDDVTEYDILLWLHYTTVYEVFKMSSTFNSSKTQHTH